MVLLVRCRHCRHEFPIAAKFRGPEVECAACGERFPFTDGPELPDTDEDYVVESAMDDGEPEIDVELAGGKSAGGKRGRSDAAHFRK